MDRIASMFTTIDFVEGNLCAFPAEIESGRHFAEEMIKIGRNPGLPSRARDIPCMGVGIESIKRMEI